MKENLIVTSIKIDKRLPNKVQLANIYYEQKNGTKRTSYQFISEAIIEKLKKEGIK